MKTFRRFDQLLDRGGELILISEARQIAFVRARRARDADAMRFLG